MSYLEIKTTNAHELKLINANIISINSCGGKEYLGTLMSQLTRKTKESTQD